MDLGPQLKVNHRALPYDKLLGRAYQDLGHWPPSIRRAWGHFPSS
jgi:hypothetical protein